MITCLHSFRYLCGDELLNKKMADFQFFSNLMLKNWKSAIFYFSGAHAGTRTQNLTLIWC